MSSVLLTGDEVAIDAEVKRQAEIVVSSAGDERLSEFLIRTETGREIPVDSTLVELLGDILTRVARGGSVSIRTTPEWLTTSAAAGMLGVSRTTLMKWIKSGELPSQMVGAHHRVRRDDLLEFKGRRESAKRKAVEGLLLLDEVSD